MVVRDPLSVSVYRTTSSLMKTPHWGSSILMMAVQVGGATALAEGPAETSTQATLTVELAGFRNDHGVARVALFRFKDGFPGDSAKAFRTAIIPISKGHSYTTFANLLPGTYAIAVIHDENNNGKLDTNWIGMPTEGVGASNNAKVTFGPPSFDSAKFTLAAPAGAQTIRIVYL